MGGRPHGGGGGGFGGGGASMVAADSAVVAFMAAVLRAESAAAAVELASAERAPHVVFRTLLAQGRDSLQLVIHHPDSLSMMDGPLDPFLPKLRAIMPPVASAARPSQTLPQRGVNGRIDRHIAERHDAIGTLTGTSDMPITITVASSSSTTVSGLDWMMDFSRGTTFPIMPPTTTHTTTMQTVCPTITTPITLNSADNATVQAVQTQLAHLGYYSGSIDGVFGPTTRDAVAKYQIAIN